MTVNLINGTATLQCYIDQDVTTGNVMMYEFFRRDVEMSIDIPLAQVSLNYINMAKSAMNAVGTAASPQSWMSNPGGTAASVMNNIIDAAAAAVSPSVQSNAAAGSVFTYLLQYIYLQIRRFGTVGKDPDTFGKPTKRHVSDLSGFTGYVQFDTSTVSISGTATEQERVRAALEGGIYIE